MENQPCQYFVILEKIGEKIEVIEMDNHHRKAKRPGMNETVTPYLKIAVAILAFMVVTAVPEKSISQIQDQSSTGAANSEMEAEAPADVSLDNLKKIRAVVENAGDLTEDLKKDVLSYLDARSSIVKQKPG